MTASSGTDSTFGTDAISIAFDVVMPGRRVVSACVISTFTSKTFESWFGRCSPTFATAVIVLDYLNRVSLGPEADAEVVADALDQVAIECSPHRDLAVNPAKMLAIALADANPLVWGGSVLAARAARRVAESIRRASGRTALAGDAEHLLPVLEAARPRDVFDDPFAEGSAGPRPVLVVLDDGYEDATVREHRGRLMVTAQERGVRVETLRTEAPTEVARYASLMLSGMYAAEYLRLGLVED